MVLKNKITGNPYRRTPALHAGVIHPENRDLTREHENDPERGARNLMYGEMTYSVSKIGTVIV